MNDLPRRVKATVTFLSFDRDLDEGGYRKRVSDAIMDGPYSFAVEDIQIDLADAILPEHVGDIFTFNETANANVAAICVPTNGQVQHSDHAVMGAGLARAFKERWPGVEVALGAELRRHGNVVRQLTTNDRQQLRHDAGHYDIPYHLLSFPTKHDWHNPSDLELIERSAKQLAEWVEEATRSGRLRAGAVLLPRVGCGAGGLDWTTVRPVLTRHLTDARFHIVDLAA